MTEKPVKSAGFFRFSVYGPLRFASSDKSFYL
jgi:hypothetical protein